MELLNAVYVLPLTCFIASCLPHNETMVQWHNLHHIPSAHVCVYERSSFQICFIWNMKAVCIEYFSGRLYWTTNDWTSGNINTPIAQLTFCDKHVTIILPYSTFRWNLSVVTPVWSKTISSIICGQNINR